MDVVGGRHTLGPMMSCPHCKARVWLQERSGGSKASPIFSICCQQGRVKVPEIEADPTLLEMISNLSTMGSEFRRNIRKYNSVLSFTSMGVTVDLELANACQGVYTFRIQGAVVHEMSTLRPAEGQPSKFAQIYFYDPDEQAARRAGFFDNTLQQERLREIQAILEISNRFCHLYKTIREREAEQGSTEDLTIVLKAAREVKGRRQRQYDLPSANEVAVLLPGDGTATEPRDIRIEGRDGRLRASLRPIQHMIHCSMCFCIQEVKMDGHTMLIS